MIRARSCWQTDVPPWLAVDRAAQVVWKGHTLIADALEAILYHCTWQPAYLADARLRFLQKVALLRAMTPEQHEALEWEMLHMLNSLRNELSHTAHPERRRQKTQRLLTCLLRLDPMTDPTAPEEVLLTRAVIAVLEFLRVQTASPASARRTRP
jgi:hypothetical protein